MSKYLFYILLLIIVSCDYQKSQKDKYPEMPTFSQEISNPEKLNLKLFSEEEEDIQAVFIKENKCIIVSYVRKDNSAVSSDSIMISDCTSFINCKKYYFKVDKSKSHSTENEVDQQSEPNISLHTTLYLTNDTIYTQNHKFSPPNYTPELLDSLFWENRGDKKLVDNITSLYNDDDVLEPFEKIVIGHTSLCGGGRLGGPLICPVYLDYFKISSLKKTIYFKELHHHNQFKILNLFNKKCLLYLPGLHKNSRLFIIDE